MRRTWRTAAGTKKIAACPMHRCSVCGNMNVSHGFCSATGRSIDHPLDALVPCRLWRKPDPKETPKRGFVTEDEARRNEGKECGND